MNRIFGRLILGAVLLAPVSLQAFDRDDHRYYDRDHHDYHAWNDNEGRAYNRYLEERHEQRDRREFRDESRERQRAYWRWRHEHSDIVLFPR